MSAVLKPYPASPELTSFVVEKLSRFHPLSDSLIAAYNKHCFQLNIAKGEYLMRSGEYSHSIYFIIKGILTGRTISKHQSMASFISVDGDFLSAIEGMYGQEPCAEDIQAEEDCLLVGISIANMTHFFDAYPEMNIIMRKILELYYKIAHQRSIFFRIGTASDKYQFFLNTYPNHAHKISVPIIASFLNIKKITLEKIIAKAALEKSKIVEHSKSDIQAMMELKQPFRKKKITLSDLAKYFRISSHQLSHLLNLHFKQNFNHFINSYRIDYVLKKMLDKSYLEQYSIDGIGSDAGFSSRSTFYTDFRKHTGLTPSAYLQRRV